MTTTAVAPTNIAILKYWGMEDEELALPTKSSISFTVEGLTTTTTLDASPKKGASAAVSLILNGKNRAAGSKEHAAVSAFISALARFFPEAAKNDYSIATRNNFPTAAGFASSASGFAALAKAFSGELPGMGRISEKKLSAIARLGSGSAARSIPSPGGLVIWHRGGMWESYAESILPADYWPELRIIYATVDESEKKVKSSHGMQMSVRSNPLYRAWADYEEGAMKAKMLAAAKARDFPALSELIMRASNNFHAICLGTYPPLRYLGEGSWRAIEAVERLNEGGIKAAYTFDAGPNAIVFALSKHGKEVASALKEVAEEVRITKPGKGAEFSKKHLI